MVGNFMLLKLFLAIILKNVEEKIETTHTKRRIKKQMKNGVEAGAGDEDPPEDEVLVTEFRPEEE